jgi:cell division protein FtsZ
VADGQAGRVADPVAASGASLAPSTAADDRAGGYAAAESPAVTVSGEPAPEVSLTGAAAGEAEPVSQGTEWPSAPMVDSGDQDSAIPAAAVPEPAAVPARPRTDPGAAARMFDAATTRRRSVVFEEDDELDVPDFLK